MAADWRRVLTGANRARVLAEINRRRSSPVSIGYGPMKRGAVLVPFIVEPPAGPEILFTVRSKKLREHRGQVSFPGGVLDKGDTGPVDTALRETEEELGIPRKEWEVWGDLPPLPGKRAILVSPVIATIPRLSIESLKLQKSEVDFVFTLPLSHLVSPGARRHTLFKNNPNLEFPVYLGGPRTIWGLTGFILDYVFKLLLTEEENH